MAGYAHDVSVYMRDPNGIKPLLEDFKAYALLSGAKLHPNKSATLRIGTGGISSSTVFMEASELRILELRFDSTGVSPNNEEVERDTTRATFEFSVTERAYLIKCIFTAKFLFAARISLPSEPEVQRLSRVCYLVSTGRAIPRG